MPTKFHLNLQLISIPTHYIFPQNSIIKKMEEKSIIDNSFMNSSISNWKIRHQFYQTNRNFRQLENRIAILELQKHKKLKDIENKLSQHKKFVQTKIYKHQLKEAIENRNSVEAKLSNSNSRIFQSIRQNRNIYIKKQQQELRMSKHKLFELTKNQRIENEKKVMVQKFEALEQKVKKRNKVRLLEIECKQNIETFWNSRLNDFSEEKKMQMGRKLKLQEEQAQRLEEIERNQQSLLEEIRKAQEVESQLNKLILQEKVMDGGKLENLYVSKAQEAAEQVC